MRHRLALALWLATPGALQGQADRLGPGAMVTDRPDQTESTSIVPRGFLQIEAGWSLETVRERGVLVHTHTLPGVLARIGVSRALEGRIAFAGYQLTSESGAGGSGLGDAELGFKYRLTAGRGWTPDVALIGAVSVPTGSSGVGSGRFDPSLLLSLSRQLGDRLSVGSNVGASWTTTTDAGGGRSTAVDLGYSLTFGIGVLERVGMFAEAFGRAPIEGGDSSLSLDGGLTWLLRDNLQVDLSGGRGVGGGAAWFAAAGLGVRLPR